MPQYSGKNAKDLPTDLPENLLTIKRILQEISKKMIKNIRLTIVQINAVL